MVLIKCKHRSHLFSTGCGTANAFSSFAFLPLRGRDIYDATGHLVGLQYWLQILPGFSCIVEATKKMIIKSCLCLYDVPLLQALNEVGMSVDIWVGDVSIYEVGVSVEIWGGMSVDIWGALSVDIWGGDVSTYELGMSVDLWGGMSVDIWGDVECRNMSWGWVSTY